MQPPNLIPNLNFAVNELTDVLMGIEEMERVDSVSAEMLARLKTHANRCRDELYVMQGLIRKSEVESATKKDTCQTT